MSIESQPAIPASLPRTAVQRDRDHLMRWASSAITALTAAASVLVVAAVALALGMT
jgi:hypothetical protein